MSWAQPSVGFTFRVKVFVVDDTYWDDGNRTTSRSHDYATLAQALAYKSDTVKAGLFKLTSAVTGTLFSRHVDGDDVILYKWSDKKWHKLDNTDIVTMLGQLVDTEIE